MKIENLDIFRILSSTELFVGVQDEHIQQLTAIGNIVTKEAGEIILGENDVGERLYTILEGRVEVSISNADKNKIIVNTIKDGGVIGELALLGNQRRAATAKAIGEVTLVSWSRKNLMQYFEENPKVGYRIIKNLAKNLANKLTATNMSLRNASS